MATRVTIGGRTYWQNREFGRMVCAKPSKLALPRSRAGEPVDTAHPIPPDSPKSAYGAGVALTDPHEQVTYRVVRNCNPADGWATTAFWQKRWTIKHEDVLRLAQRGMLDAAIEQDSQVRRYRCRDERLVLASPVIEAAHVRAGLRKVAFGKTVKLRKPRTR